MSALPLPAALEPARSEASLPVRPRLQLIDLLSDFDQLCRLLRAELENSAWLDCFLLAAGLNQLLDDHLHRDVGSLDKVASTVAHLPAPLGRPSRGAVLQARSFGLVMRDRHPRELRLRRWRAGLAELVRELATVVAAGSDGAGANPALQARAIRLLDSAEGFPERLRRRVIQLPTCFRSLDQQPEDCEQVVSDFAERWPDRERPLLVVGLRTSGSYLAPLYAAYLETKGYRFVDTMTLRPGQNYLPVERAHLGAFSADGLLLLVDDPPKSGKSMALAAESLEALGIAHGAIVMLLPLMAPLTEAPTRLRSYGSVVLPWERWAIHSRLQPHELRRVLNRLLRGRTVRLSPPGEAVSEVRVREVVEVDRIGLAPLRDLKAGSPVRRHIRELIRVTLRDAQGRTHLHHIYLKGAGLGYFGTHSLAGGEALASFLPEVYGVEEGLLFRSWLPDETRVTAPANEELAKAIATYVAARRRGLATRTDTSARLVGLNPLWQRAADLIGLGFGRARPLVRPLLHSAARRLLRVQHPSVIDGSMAISQWFAAGSGSRNRFVKVDYDERAYSNQDTVIDQLYSYDAAYDVASAAADHLISSPPAATARFGDRLLALYQEAVGESISAERWLLYQLMYVKSYLRFLESTQSEVVEGIFGRSTEGGFGGVEPGWLADEVDHLQRSLSRLDQAYLGNQIFTDVDERGVGPICGIDIDGVLETGALGFSSPGPLGAITLRALSRHGYRPVLVTGRSVEEVRDRCGAYHLAGGVAEYGAVAYDHATGHAQELLSVTQRAVLARLRRTLDGLPGIHVASAYRHAIRTYALDREGGRAPLQSETVDSILAAAGLTDQVRVVQGYSQTDFMVAGVDKATGLRGLAQMIDARGAEPQLAFAVGDTESDLPMFAMSAKAFAPSNADAAVKAAGIRLMRRPYQGGLAEATASVLGHRPGACRTCKWVAAGDTALLFSAMRAQESGFTNKLRGAIELALRTSGR